MELVNAFAGVAGYAGFVGDVEAALEEPVGEFFGLGEGERAGGGVAGVGAEFG